MLLLGFCLVTYYALLFTQILCPKAIRLKPIKVFLCYKNPHLLYPFPFSCSNPLSLNAPFLTALQLNLEDFEQSGTDPFVHWLWRRFFFFCTKGAIFMVCLVERLFFWMWILGAKDLPVSQFLKWTGVVIAIDVCHLLGFFDVWLTTISGLFNACLLCFYLTFQFYNYFFRRAWCANICKWFFFYGKEERNGVLIWQ